LTKVKNTIGNGSTDIKGPICDSCGHSLRVLDRRRWGYATVALALVMVLVSVLDKVVDIERFNVFGFDWISALAFGGLGIWILRGKRFLLRCAKCKTSKQVDTLD